MPYTHQAKATKEFGITFRSQLEAKWAYAFNELNAVHWEYIDSPWHDFVIHAPWGDAKIEIKPYGPEFFREALNRIPATEVLFIVQGEPGKVGEHSVETHTDVRCIWMKHKNAGYATEWLCFDTLLLEKMAAAVKCWPIHGIDELFRRIPEAAREPGPDITTEELILLVNTERARQGIVAPVDPNNPEASIMKPQRILSKEEIKAIFSRPPKIPPNKFADFNRDGSF